MRYLPAILSVAAILSAGSASAEKRMFIIGSADGYGIDRCLASGTACGAAAATAYCRSRAFARAASFRKIDREEITGGVSSTAPKGCIGVTCADFVAIECIR